ncbi:Glycoside hydrolase, family 17 [Corchorus capsularis]|uniref:glucan endo-1,3-beta-D-glucosidase n=1 Tax=Corchorus capsularis TaxID=210143 RepID=A0A1R3K1E3_COCAP|nr:Glycoside hydrolase, family 17 [Corchorus capsularis]
MAKSEQSSSTEDHPLSRQSGPHTPISAATIVDISSAIIAMKISHVRVLDFDPSFMRSFAFTNTRIILSIQNRFLLALATHFPTVLVWVQTHIMPYYPEVNISLISIGNTIFLQPPFFGLVFRKPICGA